MKENSIKNERSSIEEDIIILEQLIIANENCIKNAKNKDNPFVTVWKKQNIAIEHILSDYKRVLKENKELKEYIAIAPNLDEMTATKYRNIQQDAYIQGRAEEQQKAEQIIYENYIPIQKIKDKIEKEIKYHEKNILDIENTTMLKGKTAKEEAEIEFNKYAIVVLKKMLQELIEGRK